MKKITFLLARMLIAVCLTAYGSLGMAKPGGHGELFSIEICADGIVKTVLAGADGIPVDPAVDCPDCLACCHATGAIPNTTSLAAMSTALMEMRTTRPAVLSTYDFKRNIRPQPRAPPFSKDAYA